ncbi:hypothetical protein SCIP_1112 [Scardovia inopinata JCM 12537]|nr:hypothetical protein SCIP_1112 [Scardovia inopinata JCM 12537]
MGLPFVSLPGASLFPVKGLVITYSTNLNLISLNTYNNSKTGKIVVTERAGHVGESAGKGGVSPSPDLAKYSCRIRTKRQDDCCNRNKAAFG